jgi:hypothetical protein
LPDGTSEIFLQGGLDTIPARQPDGQIRLIGQRILRSDEADFAATCSTVIARLDRATSIPRIAVMDSGLRGFAAA